MATAKQVVANRANAARSTGPRTAAGRTKSSRNAFRHGLSLPLGLPTASEISRLAQNHCGREPVRATAHGRQRVCHSSL
jgi:hypothetical protein